MDEKDNEKTSLNILDTITEEALGDFVKRTFDIASKTMPSGFFNFNFDKEPDVESIAQLLTQWLKNTDRKHRYATENLTDNLAYDAEEYGRQYILEHYDRTEILEMGSWIYQVIEEKVHQYIYDRVHDEYDFSEGDDAWEEMYEALIDVAYERIRFEYIWEAIDEVIEAPLTFEDKLREIGMGIRDFL